MKKFGIKKLLRFILEFLQHFHLAYERLDNSILRLNFQLSSRRQELNSLGAELFRAQNWQIFTELFLLNILYS